MLSGSNDVHYTPVDGYGVSTFAEGISSGGTGDGAISTQGVRFYWVYDPANDDGAPSGFTGQGWFQDIVGSPIWYSDDSNKIKYESIIAGFKDGSRLDLNDVFQNWQSYVSDQKELGNDVILNFQTALKFQCFGYL